MNKIKVGLLVEEFYDEELGGFGGYGILAREYIAKYIPNQDIEIEVIIGSNKEKKVKTIEKYGTKIHYLPKNYSSKLDIDFIYFNRAKKFFKEQNFDIYLSIEMSRIAYEVMRIEKNKKLIMWIQDPRPLSDWEEIRTVSYSNEYNSYINYYVKWEKKIQILLKKLREENRLILVSQGEFLKEKAKNLYKFPENIEIKYFPNPVEINDNFDITAKKDSILFLGRLTAVKRPWIYFELAKTLPNYKFYVCGSGEELKEIIQKYKDIKNLEFMGHVSGKEKEKLLKECKVLVNTSIHEAIPVSFLEAISYGEKIVSCQNPDDITKNNGYYTGVILGDGYESVDKFRFGVEKCIAEYNEEEIKTSIKKISNNHSISKFITNMRELILKEVKNG